jgi:hypothetical protein
MVCAALAMFILPCLNMLKWQFSNLAVQKQGARRAWQLRD